MDALTECTGCWPEGTPLGAVPGGAPKVVMRFAGARSRFASSGFLPASRPSARAYRALLRAQSFAGIGLRRLSGAGGVSSDLLDEVERAYNIGARDCVRLGTAGPSQSLTVRHLDEAGAPAAFTKLGLTSVSATLIAREARILEHLDGRHAPRVLTSAAEAEKKRSLLCTAALLGSQVSYKSACPYDLEECLPDSGDPQPIETHPWVRSVAERLDSGLSRPLIELAARSNAWPVCVSHGDAAPWNALRAPSGSLQLLDWEYGAVAGLWLTDRAHWSAQVDHLIHRRSPAAAARRAVADVAAHSGVDSGAAAGVAGLMALDVAARHSGDIEQESSARWWLEFAGACQAIGGASR